MATYVDIPKAAAPIMIRITAAASAAGVPKEPETTPIAIKPAPAIITRIGIVSYCQINI